MGRPGAHRRQSIRSTPTRGGGNRAAEQPGDSHPFEAVDGTWSKTMLVGEINPRGWKLVYSKPGGLTILEHTPPWPPWLFCIVVGFKRK